MGGLLFFWLMLVSPPASCTLAGGGVMKLERAFPAPCALSSHFEDVVARDRARHVRPFGGVVSFGLNGNFQPIGVYYTAVELGTPPRAFHVQIDTGSEVSWVACSSCIGCPRSTLLEMELNTYNNSASSTASLVACSDPICASSEARCDLASNQCIYTIGYEDGSGTSGYYIADVFFFDVLTLQGGIHASAPLTFGCSNYESGSLSTPFRALDGLLGFGPGQLSVMSQLSNRGIAPWAFAHCLRGDDDGGGILILGEVLEPGIVYSPLLPSELHYELDLVSISVNGQLLMDINSTTFSRGINRGAIVDSGTSLAYLVDEAFDTLVNVVTAAVSLSTTPTISGGPHCYLVPTSVSEIFPHVSFHFAGGASMSLKPEEYLLFSEHRNEQAVWCIGFVRDPRVTILGDLVLKDKLVVYDLAHQRIGWVEHNCSSSVNVTLVHNGGFTQQRILMESNSFLVIILVFGYWIFYV